MDYRTFITRFEELKNELNEYMYGKKLKNFSRGDEIATLYKEQIESGDFSLKSFKAKIIHNELEHKRTITEFEDVITKNKDKLFVLLNEYFIDYEQEIANNTTSHTKRSDLSSYNSSIRKQKQEIINKVNNLEKDSSLKIRDDENEFNEKENIFNQEISEMNRRLGIDLQKINDQAIKQYSDIERELLDIDELKQINVLKSKIKDIRLSCLKSQYNLKIKAYNTIADSKIEFVSIKAEFNYNLSIYKENIASRLEELEYKKSLLDNDLDVKSNIYDYEYQKKCYQDIKDYRYQYLIYANKHNDFIYKLESNLEEEVDRDDFFYNYLLVNLYKLLIEIQTKNIYDPLIRIVLLLTKTVEEYRKNILEVTNEIKEKSSYDSKSLKDFIDSKEYSSEREKKHPKEQLMDNVFESTKRYYNNVLNETNHFKEKLFVYLREYLNLMVSLYNNHYSKNLDFIKFEQFATINNPLAFNAISSNYLNLYNYGYQKIEYDENKLENVKAKNVLLQTEINRCKLIVEEDYNIAIQNINKEMELYNSSNKAFQFELLKKHTEYMKESKTRITSFLVTKNKNIVSKKREIKKELNSEIRAAREYLSYKSKVL